MDIFNIDFLQQTIVFEKTENKWKVAGLAHLKNNNNLISVLNKMEEGVYSDNLMEYMGWQSIKSSPVLAVS